MSCRGVLSFVSMTPDKFAVTPTADGCNATAGSDAGCWMSIRLSRSRGVASPDSSLLAPSSFQLNYMFVLFIRSWEPTLGDSWAWLTCSQAPRFHTSPVPLTSLWTQMSTQTSMQQIFRAGETSVWEDLTHPNASSLNSSLSIDGQAAVDSRQLPCVLDEVYIWQKTAGTFRFVGYMWDSE